LVALYGQGAKLGTPPFYITPFLICKSALWDLPVGSICIWDGNSFFDRGDPSGSKRAKNFL